MVEEGRTVASRIESVRRDHVATHAEAQNYPPPSGALTQELRRLSTKAQLC